jgi:hypothetical protein
MDRNGFWTLVDSAREGCRGDCTGVPDAVAQVLIALGLREIADFAQIQDALENAADREDLWLACVLLNGGFGSDDGFLYFRGWLIAQGRAVYAAALADPDSLADVPAAVAVTAEGDDFADCENFLYVANTAWEEVTGDEDGLAEELRSRGFEPTRGGPGSPVTPDFPVEDRDRVFAVVPRLATLFYDRADASRRCLDGPG